MREAPTSEWPNAQILAALSKRGWMPGGQHAAHTVRSMLAEMARSDQLVNVARGAYMLPENERTESA